MKGIGKKQGEKGLMMQIKIKMVKKVCSVDLIGQKFTNLCFKRHSLEII